MTARQRHGRHRRERQLPIGQADPPARESQPAATPGGGRLATAGRGAPDYVIEVWASDQLRSRSGMSLWEALEAGRKPATAGAQPDPELEAEP